MVLQRNDAGSWKMTVASCPVSHVGLSRSGLGWAGLGSSWEVRSQRCESGLPVVRLPLSSIPDVSAHQWLMSPLRTWLTAHLQQASQLPAERRDRRTALRTKIRAELPQSRCSFIYLFFLESPGTEIRLASSPLWVMCPRCIYSPLFVCLLQIRRRFLERRNTGAASFMPLMSLYLSQSSYSITRQALYSQEQQEWKGTFFFNCRGCNSMLSKPIVEQKLHLFFSWLVYRGCCSSRRLDSNNFAASNTSKKSVNATKTSVSIHKPVFSSSQRREDLR